MAKFPEVAARLFRGVFVCRRCKTKKRAKMTDILQKKIKCRRCGGKAFRPIKRAK